MVSFVGQHVLIRDYLNGYLGKEDDFEAAVSHNQFTWFILHMDESKPFEPDAPSYGPAPVIEATPHGFEIVPETPKSDELAKVGQAALFSAILRRLKVLDPVADRLSNGFPGLVAEYKNYKIVLGSNLAELDIPTLWAAGAGVAEFVRALEAPTTPGNITEALEPEELAGFRALVSDHSSFIFGFAFAKDMLAHAQAMHELSLPIDATKERTKSLLSSIKSRQGLMSAGASALIESLDRALGFAQASGAAVVSVSYDTGRNCLIAFGKAVHRLAGAPIVEIVAISDTVAQVAGTEHVELLQTAVDYLWENEGLILNFASSSPQMSIWLQWLIQQIVLPLRKD